MEVFLFGVFTGVYYTLKNYFVFDGGLKKWFVEKNPVEFTIPIWNTTSFKED